MGSEKKNRMHVVKSNQFMAMKYPGPVMPLKYCGRKKGRENSKSFIPSNTIDMAGPEAAPSAVAIAKAADVTVRRLNGVASAT